MKHIIIEYDGDEFLPEEINDAIEKTQKRICEDHLEYDKIICHIGALRGEIIRFLAANGKMIEEKKK